MAGTLNTPQHVVCVGDNGCSFRVHSRYFEQKTRFAPGVCPNCNGPIAIVTAYSNLVDPNYRMVTDPGEDYPLGAVIRVEPAS